ncbi:MAG: hypothetical protein IJS96_03795 [Schwartzia sp.]|nr:hypothetical protein [Schwartzia sp. (in: firmicutes)]
MAFYSGILPAPKRAGIGPGTDTREARHAIYQTARIAYLCAMYGPLFSPGRFSCRKAEDLPRYDAPGLISSRMDSARKMIHRNRHIHNAYKKGHLACFRVTYQADRRGR